MRIRLTTLLAMATIMCACSAAPATTDAPTSSAMATSSSTNPSDSAPTAFAAGASSSPAQDSAPVGPPPTARVVKTTPSNESPMYLHVEVGFDNKSARPCKILGYALSWPGGKKDIMLENFTVPPRDGKTRSVKVHPDDGDLKSLSPEQASVVVRSDCDGAKP